MRPPSSRPAVDHPTDIHLELDRLRSFLERHLDTPLHGPLRAERLSGGRSNPTHRLTDGSRRWILRRPPAGPVPGGAHDISREYRVMTALRDSAVPVPRTVCLSAGTDGLGAPFYVMDAVEGRTLRTGADTEVLSLDQRRRLGENLVDTLVALHEIDPARCGLDGWGRPDGFLTRQLERWRRQWYAIATRECPEVDKIIAMLGPATPPLRFPGIVHGDYKIDNVLVGHQDPTRILAVLDWEMATTGDTLADLGLLVSFWDEPGAMFNPITAGATAHPGFPSAGEIIGRYADRRGIDPAMIDWYVAFSDLKVAVLLEQIHARYLRGETVGAGFDDIGDMVAPLLARSLNHAASLNPTSH